MEDRDRLKITRNLTALKERIGADLDPILDRLIERDIFDIRIKDEIDNVLPPTPHKKADTLLRKLLRSSKAYPAFKDILLERGGYDDLVYKMENIQPDIPCAVSNDREQAISSDQEEDEQTSRKTLSVNDKDDIHFQIEKPEDTTDAAEVVMSKEMLTALIDERVDGRVQEMNDEVNILKADLEALSEERIALLKKIDELEENMVSSNNKRYKKKYADKKEEAKALRKSIEKLEKENNKHMKEVNKLRFELTRKDREIEDLKKRISRMKLNSTKPKHAQESDLRYANAKFKLREWLSSLRMKVVFPRKLSKE